MTHCMRCEQPLVGCDCPDPNADSPEYRTLEAERPAFEAFMRMYFPERTLDRYGHTYADDKTRNRWIGWQAKARWTPAKIIARRA